MSWILRLWAFFQLVRTLITRVTSFLKVTGIMAASMVGWSIGTKRSEDKEKEGE